MEVKTRAPGKIILAGEHAVVHGSTAVAASIDLYTHVHLRLHPENGDILKLELNDSALDLSWSIEKIREALSGSGCPFSSNPTSCPPKLMSSLTALVDEQVSLEGKAGMASGVIAFLWLYTSILGFKPATVTVTSELPLGAGLGSSAAYCVALSAALLSISHAVALDAGQKGWLAFQDADLELLNRWAFEGEKILHGNPSGIDNTVSSHGNMIRFKTGNLTLLKSNMPLTMLITHTKVGRNTKALVGGVSERTSRHPVAMASVFNAVDSISNEVTTLIQSPAAADEISVTEKEQKLGELMEMNQGLLQCMGVSHASIETVLRTTSKYKLTSKLTGAGGGGCVLTLLPTFLSATMVEEVSAELESCGFQCLTAGIGGKGVQICFQEHP